MSDLSTAPSTVPLDLIQLGERVRKDMGDLSGLAASIQRHGLLHPIVIKSDNTLVAGHRRLEAARSIGWTDIPVTIIDVADLLSAERDENAERKDFTPTEAIAIGRLIEEQHKAVIAERQHDLRIKANKIKVALREGTTDVKNIDGPEAAGRTADVASAAVGMSASRYVHARAVVEAAESDPEKFGDLPGQMDETGNVKAAFTEVQRRKAAGEAPKPRHPVHRKTHYPQRNREMERAITALDGICTCLESIPLEELDASRCNEWSDALKKSASTIGRVARAINGKA